jgi:hypothetical protein
MAHNGLKDVSPATSAYDAVDGSTACIAMCQLRLLIRHRECPVVADSVAKVG